MSCSKCVEVFCTDRYGKHLVQNSTEYENYFDEDLYKDAYSREAAVGHGNIYFNKLLWSFVNQLPPVNLVYS